MPEINSTSDLTDAFDAVYQEDPTERHRRVVEGYRDAGMAVLRNGGANAGDCVSHLIDGAADAYDGVTAAQAADVKQHAINRARVAADRGDEAAKAGAEAPAAAPEVAPEVVLTTSDAEAQAEEDESLASA